MDKPIPDYCGWIEVPEDKPMSKDGVTDAMIGAGSKAFLSFSDNNKIIGSEVVKAVYLAMLRASPPVSTDGRANLIRLALEDADALERIAEEADDNNWQDWAAMMRQAAIRIRSIAETPVSTDGLVERLRSIARFRLENPDLAIEWHAADRIEQLTATLADRDATIERRDAALRWVYENGLPHSALRPDFVNDAFSEAFASIRSAALDASATDHD